MTRHHRLNAVGPLGYGCSNTCSTRYLTYSSRTFQYEIRRRSFKMFAQKLLFNWHHVVWWPSQFLNKNFEIKLTQQNNFKSFNQPVFFHAGKKRKGKKERGFFIITIIILYFLLLLLFMLIINASDCVSSTNIPFSLKSVDTTCSDFKWKN